MLNQLHVHNPHNKPIEKGSPTRIRMPDGRMYFASWGRPEWRDVRNNCWIAELPADAAIALDHARQS
jgi:hypothetical protein